MLFLEIDVKLIIFAIPVFLVLMMVMAWGLVLPKRNWCHRVLLNFL